MTTRILDIALNSVWAMEEEALTNLLTIAAREHKIDTEALEAYRAKALANAERTTFRQGVAIMAVDGALFPKANLMTDISGATSYDILRRDLQASLDDSKVKAIIMSIDSPGGSVKELSELAEAIYQARGTKPIVAYVRGTCASAAYFLASAADHIVVNDMSEVGSIGAMLTLSKSEDPKGTTTYQFISSQSPMKNVDPGTEAGAKSYQSRVDTMAQVFIETAARNRGVDTETALKNFGKGGILIGKEAVEAGLADAVGNFEAVLAELAGGKKPGSKAQASKGTSTRMTDKSETTAEAVVTAPAVAAAAPAVDVNAAVQAALSAERTRTSGIDRIAAAHAVEASVVAKAKEDGTEVAAFALQVADLASAKSKLAGDAALAALKTDEEAAAKAAPSDGSTEAGETVDSVAARIAAA